MDFLTPKALAVKEMIHKFCYMKIISAHQNIL